MERFINFYHGRMDGNTDRVAEMGKLIALIKENNVSSFVFSWKPLLDFMLKTETNKTLILGFDD